MIAEEDIEAGFCPECGEHPLASDDVGVLTCCSCGWTLGAGVVVPIPEDGGIEVDDARLAVGVTASFW